MRCCCVVRKQRACMQPCAKWWALMLRARRRACTKRCHAWRCVPGMPGLRLCMIPTRDEHIPQPCNWYCAAGGGGGVHVSTADPEVQPCLPAVCGGAVRPHSLLSGRTTCTSTSVFVYIMLFLVFFVILCTSCVPCAGGSHPLSAGPWVDQLRDELLCGSGVAAWGAPETRQPRDAAVRACRRAPSY